MCLFQLSALAILALGHSQGNGGAWSCSTAVPRMAESAPQHRISRTSSTGAIPGTTEQDLWDQPSRQQLLETSLQCHRCALGWGQRGRVTFVPLPPLGVVALPNPCLPGCLLSPPGDLLGGHAACHGAPQSLSAPPTPGPPGRKSWLLHQCYESAGLIPAPNPSSKGTDTNCCWRGQAVGSAQERMEGLGLPHQLLQLSQPHLPFHIHQHHVHAD